MWGGTDQRIIGYGDFSYQRPGKEMVEWFIVGLARQKGHIKAVDDIDLDVLAELVTVAREQLT